MDLLCPSLLALVLTSGVNCNPLSSLRSCGKTFKHDLIRDVGTLEPSVKTLTSYSKSKHI